MPVEELQQSILDAVRAFTQRRHQSDDITLLVVRYRKAARLSTDPAPSSPDSVPESLNSRSTRSSLRIGTILTMGVPEVIGRYEIVEELGRGAMGSVFKAQRPRRRPHRRPQNHPFRRRSKARRAKNTARVFIARRAPPACWRIPESCPSSTWASTKARPFW